MRDQTTYVIWSYRHHLWWRSASAGYTQHIKIAGHYSKAQAAEIMFDGLPGQNVAIEAEFAEQLFSGLSPDEITSKLDSFRSF